MTLFDHVPEATFPAGNVLPSRAQDLLEEYRMAAQRAFDMECRLKAEREHIADLQAKLRRALRPGQSVQFAGLRAVRARGGVVIEAA